MRVLLALDISAQELDRDEHAAEGHDHASDADRQIVLEQLQVDLGRELRLDQLGLFLRENFGLSLRHSGGDQALDERMRVEGNRAHDPVPKAMRDAT